MITGILCKCLFHNSKSLIIKAVQGADTDLVKVVIYKIGKYGKKIGEKLGQLSTKSGKISIDTASAPSVAFKLLTRLVYFYDYKNRRQNF